MTLNPQKKHARHAVSRGKVAFVPAEEVLEQMDQPRVQAENAREYECEVCGRKETLTEKGAYEAGWDYPPFIGAWGIVSPRTCPVCPMIGTAWWHLIKNGGDNLSEKHMATIKRILAEKDPSSV